MARTRQEWCCEECGKNGAVLLNEHESAFGGFVKVMDSHTDKSPDCRGGRTDICVRNRELCNPGEWGGVCKAARIESLKRKFIVNESEVSHG